MNESGIKKHSDKVDDLATNNEGLLNNATSTQRTMQIEGSEGDNRESEEDNIEESEREDEVIQRVILPKDIHIIPKPLSLDNILKRIKREKINFFTEYQRLPNLWDNIKKSRFIESILLRLPLPVFYFYGDETEGEWEVIDGLQRLSTIKDFVIDNNLILTNLEYLKDLHGLTFSQLPGELQTRIEEATITAYIITPNTPEEVKYTLFRRINTAALILKPQEIRHALNQGLPANLLKELSQEIVFKIATGNKIPNDRMQDREFVNRFVAYYLKGYEAYKPDLDTFLNDGLAEVKKLDSEGVQLLKKAFIESMKRAKAIFENHSFRKRYSIYDYRKPLNKALFDVWSYHLAKISDEEANDLIGRRDILKEKFITVMNNSRFDDAVSFSTGDPVKVNYRFSEIGRIIQETLNQL